MEKNITPTEQAIEEKAKLLQEKEERLAVVAAHAKELADTHRITVIGGAKERTMSKEKAEARVKELLLYKIRTTMQKTAAELATKTVQDEVHELMALKSKMEAKVEVPRMVEEEPEAPKFEYVVTPAPSPIMPPPAEVAPEVPAVKKEEPKAENDNEIKIDPAVEKEAKYLVNFIDGFSNETKTQEGTLGQGLLNRVIAISKEVGAGPDFERDLSTHLFSESGKKLIINKLIAYKYLDLIKGTKNIEDLKAIKALAKKDPSAENNDMLEALFGIQENNITEASTPAAKEEVKQTKQKVEIAPDFLMTGVFHLGHFSEKEYKKTEPRPDRINYKFFMIDKHHARFEPVFVGKAIPGKIKKNFGNTDEYAIDCLNKPTEESTKIVVVEPGVAEYTMKDGKQDWHMVKKAQIRFESEEPAEPKSQENKEKEPVFYLNPPSAEAVDGKIYFPDIRPHAEYTQGEMMFKFRPLGNHLAEFEPVLTDEMVKKVLSMDMVNIDLMKMARACKLDYTSGTATKITVERVGIAHQDDAGRWYVLENSVPKLKLS